MKNCNNASGEELKEAQSADLRRNRKQVSLLISDASMTAGVCVRSYKREDMHTCLPYTWQPSIILFQIGSCSERREFLPVVNSYRPQTVGS